MWNASRLIKNWQYKSNFCTKFEKFSRFKVERYARPVRLWNGVYIPCISMPGMSSHTNMLGVLIYMKRHTYTRACHSNGSGTSFGLRILAGCKGNTPHARSKILTCASESKSVELSITIGTVLPVWNNICWRIETTSENRRRKPARQIKTENTHVVVDKKSNRCASFPCRRIRRIVVSFFAVP